MVRKKHTVLVTGGAGFIGSVLCKRLLREGYGVHIFDVRYFPRVDIKDSFPGVTIVEGDIRTPPPDLFDGIDSVIHLAALSNDPTAEFNPIMTMQINRDATKNFATLAKNHGVSRFIFASSCSIYDRGTGGIPPIADESFSVLPIKPYPLSKYMAEQDILSVQNKSFCTVILRKGTVFGFSPRMRYDLLINTMIRDALFCGEIHVFCRGLQWRPLISVDHVAAVYQSLLELPTSALHGQTFNISDGNFMIKNVAETIRDIFLDYFDKKITIRYEQDDRIDRSYRVSTKKAEKRLGFIPNHDLRPPILEEIRTIMDKPDYQDFDNPLYYNMKQLEVFFTRANGQ